jgi:hypothetical protein
MIPALSPHAKALLCIIIANALAVDPATVAAFLIQRPSLHGPCGTWTLSSFYRAIETSTTTTSPRLFGNILGKDGADAKEGIRDVELVRINIPKGASSPANDVAFDSLSIMMREWAKSFVVDDLGDRTKNTGLTTPVEVVDLSSPGGEDEEEYGDAVKFSRVQLLFKKGKTGGRSAYEDKDDARYNKNEGEGRKDNVDALKEGGVEVRVEKMSSGDLRVIASRCEIEEGTMTKEMSEKVIIDSLGKAISAWRKEQAS